MTLQVAPGSSTVSSATGSIPAEGMLAALGQLDTQLTTEVERTSEAFQRMNGEIRGNIQAVAAENSQLRGRITQLEGNLQQEQTLRQQERQSTLQSIQTLQSQIQKLTADLAAVRNLANQNYNTERSRELRDAPRWAAVRVILNRILSYISYGNSNYKGEFELLNKV